MSPATMLSTTTPKCRSLDHSLQPLAKYFRQYNAESGMSRPYLSRYHSPIVMARSGAQLMSSISLSKQCSRPTQNPSTMTLISPRPIFRVMKMMRSGRFVRFLSRCVKFINLSISFCEFSLRNEARLNVGIHSLRFKLYNPKSPRLMHHI